EVVLETFILFEDKVGLALQAALLAAARRGVQVDVMVDGFGSPDLSPQYVRELTEAGVRFRIFDAGSGILGRRLKMLRRMHRKIIVVDGSLAFIGGMIGRRLRMLRRMHLKVIDVDVSLPFIGGINFSADHLDDFGPEAKQDYAVAIQGPVVEDILHFANAAIADADGIGRSWFQPR